PEPEPVQPEAPVKPLTKTEQYKKGLSEFFMPTSTLPEREKWLDIRSKGMGDVQRTEDHARKTFKRLDKLPQDIKKQMFQHLDGELHIDKLPAEHRALARRLRRELNRVGRAMVKVGIMDQETLDKRVKGVPGEQGDFFKGSLPSNYIHYIYLRNVLGDDTRIPIGSSGKMDMGQLKQRKGFSKEEQRAIGLIEDVSVAVPVGLARSWSDVMKANMLAEISKNPNWVWQPSIVDVDGQKMSIQTLSEEVEYARRMNAAEPG
ncbi:unnamed protein product, partial [marine sediment metagenome]